MAGLAREAAAAEAHYKASKQIPIGGGSGWDYLSADAEGRRLYVTHRTKVVVIDMDENKIVGEIADTPGVHGFVTVPDLKRGFSSNGQENKSSVVDLETLKTVMKVPTGANPDALLFEPKSGEIWTFNGRGKTATAFDAKTGKVIAEAIPLEGKPESGAADPEAGRIYVNLEDKSEIAVLDVKEHKLLEKWPIAPGKSATGLAIDVKLHRLIIGCSNSKMVMMDSTNGKVVSTLDCGQGVDAAAFDPGTQLAFTSNGADGTVTIVHEDTPDKFTVVQTLKTELGARTMIVDLVSHRLYLASAKFQPAADGKRPMIIPGSMKVLVYALKT